MTLARDPVCGMTVLPNQSLEEHFGKDRVYFCSEYCRSRFLSDPGRYVASLVRETTHERNTNRRIAYFSMEVAIGREMHTYSGGLGVLAGTLSAGRLP